MRRVAWRPTRFDGSTTCWMSVSLRVVSHGVAVVWTCLGFASHVRMPWKKDAGALELERFLLSVDEDVERDVDRAESRTSCRSSTRRKPVMSLFSHATSQVKSFLA